MELVRLGPAARDRSLRLERDVVVRRASARALARTAGGRRLEVRSVRRDVALRREAGAAAVLAGVARTEELDRVGDDVHRLALVPLLVLPLAPLEAAVNRDGAPLLEVLGAVLALGPPD